MLVVLVTISATSNIGRATGRGVPAICTDQTVGHGVLNDLVPVQGRYSLKLSLGHEPPCLFCLGVLDYYSSCLAGILGEV